MSRHSPSAWPVAVGSVVAVVLLALSAVPAVASDDPAPAPATSAPAAVDDPTNLDDWDDPESDDAAFDAEFAAFDAEFAADGACDFETEDCWENGVRLRPPGSAASHTSADRSRSSKVRRSRARKRSTALRRATLSTARVDRRRRVPLAAVHVAEQTAGAQPVPRGGVQAGAGGRAEARAANDDRGWLSVAAGAVALLGGLRLRRRRSAA